MLLLSLNISGRRKEKQKRGGKLRISQARSFQDHAVHVLKVAPGLQQSRMKFCCWQLISSCDVHTLPASGCLCPGSSITSTSSCKWTSVVCWKGQGAGRHPWWAASCFVLFTGSKEAAEDTVKRGSREIKVLCAAVAPSLAQSSPLQPDPATTMQPFFPWKHELDVGWSCSMMLLDQRRARAN